MPFIILTDLETKTPVAINTDDISTVNALSMGDRVGDFAVDELVITRRSAPDAPRSYYLPKHLQAMEVTDPAEALGRFAHWVESLS
ncbi:hypothetical protein GCM10028787_32890 [Brachybacterium horti]